MQLLVPVLITQVAPPGPAARPGMVDFFLHSGLMAKLVLGILLFFSIASWAVVVAKTLQLRRADRQSRRFLQVFHRSSRFSEVSAVTRELRSSPLVGLFQAGYAEIDAQIKTAGGQPEGRERYRIRSVASLERTLQRAVNLEIQGFSRWTPFLATTAAATPFIGLFGTVWGIMVAFQNIGVTGSTSIVTVAPGIAEALVNTAAGLGAAIPALVAYNYFANRIRTTRARLEDFALEFLNLSERNFT